MFASDRRGPKKSEAITLRVFFHPYGRKVILLLGGYDKGKIPASPANNVRSPPHVGVSGTFKSGDERHERPIRGRADRLRTLEAL